MPLVRGTRIGPYEVLDAIGHGGMGEVYRATDTNLKRSVAIKVLPESFASDAERLARFQREAEVLAALTHPNVAAIYGLEHGGGTTALVMELVDGPTLADRIAQGPVPLDEALSIAGQIAEALQVAHEQGIVHRDIKPANIKLRPDGTVKVLDFGLAKSSGASAAATVAPTITSPVVTVAGMLLGTAAYMSPEQARGRSVDQRTDVWAFGCVLYEMLTGQRAFDDQDISMTLSNVLQREPDLDALPPSVPARVRQTLRACLQKDPKRRVHSMADVQLALAGAFESSTPGLATAPSRLSARTFALLGASALLVTVTLAALVPGLRSRDAPRPPAPSPRFAVRLPPGTTGITRERAGTAGIMALSPDGSRLATRGASGTLVLHTFDGRPPRVLAGMIDGVPAVVFSPDGRWVTYQAGGRLWKVSVEGAAPVPLCSAPNVRGASWGNDGAIVLAADRLGGLSRCPENGGALEPLTTLETGEFSHRWPQAVPGGDAVLFTSSGVSEGNQPDTNSIAVYSRKSRQRKTLWTGGTYGRYLPSGHLVFVSQGTLFAVPMDIERLAINGAPQAIVEGIESADTGSDNAWFDVSASGTVAYATAAPAPRRSALRLDRSGHAQPLVPGEEAFALARFLPDGRTLFTLAPHGLWVFDPARGTRQRLTDKATPSVPIATRDGRFVLFPTRDGRRNGISVIRPDGSGEVVLVDQRSVMSGISLSPDGTTLAFGERSAGSGFDIWTVPVDLHGDVPRATGDPRLLLRTPANERAPSFSPDGRWLAYLSDESGRSEMYLRAVAGSARGIALSGDGAGLLVGWASASELMYLNRSGQIMSVPVAASGDAPALSKPRLITQLRPGETVTDVAPDGRSFAVIRAAGADAATPPEARELVFMLNVFDEIRRRLAAAVAP